MKAKLFTQTKEEISVAGKRFLLETALWKIRKHKELKSQLDLRVGAMLREICLTTYAESSSEFKGIFDRLLKNIKSTNQYSADILYRMTERNPDSAEVWKMTPEGDYKNKLFTITRNQT